MKAHSPMSTMTYLSPYRVLLSAANVQLATAQTMAYAMKTLLRIAAINSAG